MSGYLYVEDGMFPVRVDKSKEVFLPIYIFDLSPKFVQIDISGKEPFDTSSKDNFVFLNIPQNLKSLEMALVEDVLLEPIVFSQREEIIVSSGFEDFKFDLKDILQGNKKNKLLQKLVPRKQFYNIDKETMSNAVFKNLDWFAISEIYAFMDIHSKNYPNLGSLFNSSAEEMSLVLGYVALLSFIKGVSNVGYDFVFSRRLELNNRLDNDIEYFNRKFNITSPKVINYLCLSDLFDVLGESGICNVEADMIKMYDRIKEK